MMSALTQKHDEVKRLLELYSLYKDSDDDWRRRKVHLDLDRFLMENRETAILCIERVLADEVQAASAPKKRKWWRFNNDQKNFAHGASAVPTLHGGGHSASDV